IGQSFARDDVLINSNSSQICESLLVAGIRHDPVVARWCTANEEVTEYRCTRRRSAYNATTREYFPERLLRLRTRVSVDEMKLPPTLEPDSAGMLEHRDERVGIGELPVGREQNAYVSGTGVPPQACSRRILPV